MKAVDTNVLVRLLTGDDPNMQDRATSLVDDSEDAGETLFVSVLVVLEMIWVLRSKYRYSRADVLDAFDSLLGVGGLHFEASECIRGLIAAGRLTGLDLADALIGLYARELGCEVTLTFDKRAAQSEWFEEVA